MMTNDVTLQKFPDHIPFCEKCGRQVDYFEVETPVQRVEDQFSGYITASHTGEVIVSVTCHGETWKMSNWHGRID